MRSQTFVRRDGCRAENSGKALARRIAVALARASSYSSRQQMRLTSLELERSELACGSSGRAVSERGICWERGEGAAAVRVEGGRGAGSDACVRGSRVATLGGIDGIDARVTSLSSAAIRWAVSAVWWPPVGPLGPGRLLVACVYGY
jgi:hypothetical protein